MVFEIFDRFPYFSTPCISWIKGENCRGERERESEGEKGMEDEKWREGEKEA